MSGIQGTKNGGGSTTYLKVVGNALWQTGGAIDPEHPLYVEEEYTFGEKTGIRKGYKIGAVTGMLDSVFFKEGKFGETMDVYMDVVIDSESGKTSRYCINFPFEGGWDKHQVTKRMIIGLMYLDTGEEFTVNVSASTNDDFTSTNMWISQGGKNLVLNLTTDPEKIDLNRQIEVPIAVLELCADIRTPDPEEMKDLTPKKKIRFREDELDDLKSVMESEVLPRLNANKVDNKAASAEPTTEPTATEEPAQEEEKPNGGAIGGGGAKKTDTPPVEAKPKRETARERIARLKAEQAAKK